ncbi:unnamed protein product [Didymodactylos carnosus]|uniref:Uncharacterized protein n=1 Tax=Didymodactylos carnosus TaxID=1234261 RepID=A0A816D4R6_9BILA|nr:unnamed protein product [Didymodactylos carnosus]CAF4528527.1 unnamed protein product [Didymodactylos carnosus]
MLDESCSSTNSGYQSNSPWNQNQDCFNYSPYMQEKTTNNQSLDEDISFSIPYGKKFEVKYVHDDERTCLFGTIKYILCNIGMDNEYYDLAAKLNKEDRNIHNAFQENCTTSHSENIQQQGFGDAGIILSSFSQLCKIEFRVCFMQNNNITQIFRFDENFNFTHCAYILYDGNRTDSSYITSFVFLRVDLIYYKNRLSQQPLKRKPRNNVMEYERKY